MSTIPVHLSEEHGSMFESLGPHFCSRIFKEETGGSRGDALDADLFETYHIELWATRLGMSGIVFVVLRVCADFGDTELLDAYTNGEDQRKNVGSATVSITGTRSQDSQVFNRSCKIEQLDFETGNFLTNMGALTAILRRIQSFCLEHHAEHLVMNPVQGSCWFSGLLKPTGFNLCGCERLDDRVGVGTELCMVLPTSPIKAPVRINADKPGNEPANKTGKRPDQKFGAVDEGSTLGKLSLAQHEGTGTSPVASHGATGSEGSQALEQQVLIDSTTNKATASSKTPKGTRRTTKIADVPSQLSKKEYCMYWIRKGECDYIQTGCKYKHEMPIDEETRQKLGLREIPMWFRESPEYYQFLRQVNRSAIGRLTGVGNDEKNTLTGRLSRPGSGRGDSGIGPYRGGRTATTSRDPAKLGSYTVQSPHENHQQSTIASNTEAETARASSPSASNINSTKAANASADRRSDRDIYKPPRARASSGASDIRVANKEKAKVKGSIIEEPSKGHAESRGRSRNPASSMHSGPSKEGLSSSRSAADSAPSMLSGSTKTQPSSPVEDVNDHRTGLGFKRPRGRRGGGRGRNNGQNSN